MPIWPLATILHVQQKSDLTEKCLNTNVDCNICSQYIFKSSRQFWKGEGRLMDLVIGKSCSEMVVGFREGDFIN